MASFLINEAQTLGSTCLAEAVKQKQDTKSRIENRHDVQGDEDGEEKKLECIKEECE
jgi:hypothetical protein